MKMIEDIKRAVSKIITTYEPDINMWVDYRYRRGV